MLNKKDRFAKARELGYRSGLEVVVAEQLKTLGINARYEEIVIGYTPPNKPRRYSPDYVLPNGIVIETKGRFVSADRQKHKAIKAQYPDLDIRFVFSNAKAKLNKTSTTRYSEWCETYGFKWSNHTVPPAWAQEPANPKAIMALQSSIVKGTF